MVKHIMKWVLYFCVIISRDCQGYDILDFTFTKSMRSFMSDLVGKTISDPQLLKEAIINDKIQKPLPKSTDFPCRFIKPEEGKDKFQARNGLNENKKSGLPLGRSLVRPKSVHALRPGDIDVIGALGDSFTAGNGAAGTNVFQLSTENRGISWSAGGQGTWRQYLTLPNILKVFNPNLIGYSLNDSLEFQNASQFNVAKPMAGSRHLPDMAKELVNRIRNDKRVDIENDWKLITLMIGGNDFCSYICMRSDPLAAPEDHRKDMMETILILKNNIPRAFVNIVPVPDTNVMMSINPERLSPICNLYRKMECRCKYVEERIQESNQKIFKRWINIDLQLENAPELNDKEDFAVVVQPFSMGASLPEKNGETDLSLLSADCFHFSQKGHAYAANSLWNNMLEPKGKKQHGIHEVFKLFNCPTLESPYLFTTKNSKPKNTN